MQGLHLNQARANVQGADVAAVRNVDTEGKKVFTEALKRAAVDTPITPCRFIVHAVAPRLHTGCQANRQSFREHVEAGEIITTEDRGEFFSEDYVFHFRTPFINGGEFEALEFVGS